MQNKLRVRIVNECARLKASMGQPIMSLNLTPPPKLKIRVFVAVCGYLLKISYLNLFYDYIILNMRKIIHKAIIPVAGMGTRFLPATKAQPKEMLPVVDKPIIQYIVEEAVAAGIEEIIFVTAIGRERLKTILTEILNWNIGWSKRKRTGIETNPRSGQSGKIRFRPATKPSAMVMLF